MCYLCLCFVPFVEQHFLHRSGDEIIFLNVHLTRNEEAHWSKECSKRPRFCSLREFRKKENVTFNGNGTVSYVEKKWYEFVPEMSVGSDDDEVTVINIPLVVSARSSEHIFGFICFESFEDKTRNFHMLRLKFTHLLFPFRHWQM